jgi:hypothetical protein
VDLRPKLVLLLNSSNQLVEVGLQGLNFLVNFFGYLVFGSVFEDTFFDFFVNLFDLLSHVHSGLLQVLDLVN